MDDPIDDDAAYRALTSRDARFDGRLFVGVTSTGIYCRPVCRVRPPKRANCRFFLTAAQAEAAAFRPCLKCRPEIAPGAARAWSVMDASRTLAAQALDHLDGLAGGFGGGADDSDAPSLAALAARLGISDRHLRRIFVAEHGVTPLQHLQTRRLLLAKQLLTDSRLPVSQVALASGFRSLRRFNAAFAENYRMSPGRLRRDAVIEPVRRAAARDRADGRRRDAGDASDAGDAADGVSVTLAYRAPYDVHGLLRFFARRAIPGVEQVDADGAVPRIRRSVRAGVLSPRAGWIEAAFPAQAAQVRLSFCAGWARDSARVVAAARRWLDLDASPAAIADAIAPIAAANPHIASACRGMRLPGCLDAFELAVRAVLGQQVTVAGARTLASRLVDRFGEPLTSESAPPWPAPMRSFPSPEVLAAAAPERIGELGIIRSRSAAIVALARAWPELASLLAPAQPPQPLVAALRALPGVGPWTAHYVAMRALSWPDVFLPNDVALLKALRRLGNPATTLTTAMAATVVAVPPLRQCEADALAEAWRPWRSYAVLALWNTLEPTHPGTAT